MNICASSSHFGVFHLLDTAKKTFKVIKHLKVRCAKWNSSSKKNLHANKFKGNVIMMESPAKEKQKIHIKDCQG